jgi:hypothetical protein
VKEVLDRRPVCILDPLLASFSCRLTSRSPELRFGNEELGERRYDRRWRSSSPKAFATIPVHAPEGRLSAVGESNRKSRDELLTEWRSAERASRDARDAESVTNLAMRAAGHAEEAALETMEAAIAAADAAKAAERSAAKARKSAGLAVAAAQDLTAAAEGDQARAVQAIEEAAVAETAAQERYNQREQDEAI